MTYLRGEECTLPHDVLFGKARRTTFIIKCDETVKEINWEFTSNFHWDCHAEFTVKHKAGCPVDFYGGLFGSYALSVKQVVYICVLGAVVLYAVVSFFNKK